MNIAKKKILNLLQKSLIFYEEFLEEKFHLNI